MTSTGSARRVAWGALLGLAALAVVVWPRAALAEGSVAGTARLRTSLVWIWGDDDVLHPPADRAPPSPGPGIGDRAGYAALYEGFSSRYTGRENRSELRLLGEAPGLIAGITTRAGLALGFELSSLGERAAPLLAADLGSFAELVWTFAERPAGRSDAVTLRLLPVNGDRERVGELEALAWGGAVGPHWESPYASASGPVRAGRLELALGLARAHVGVKTASFLESQPQGPAVEETSYGVYGGVESRWSARIMVALGFGHFEHGRLPGPAGSPRATTTGVSLRLAGGTGRERPRPPVAFMSDGSPFDRSPPLARGTVFSLGLEAAHLVQRLWDADRSGASVLAPARAAALLAELSSAGLDLRFACVVRDPSFVMRHGLGVLPAQSISHAAAERPEVAALASVGFFLGKRATPTLSVGVLWPAAVTTRAVDRDGQPIGATLLVRGPGDVEALPPAEAPVPVLDLRPGLELRLSSLLELVAWLGYRRDFNRTRFVATPEGTLALGFRSPDQLGYGLAARAVW
jgi:hypothetical protein